MVVFAGNRYRICVDGSDHTIRRTGRVTWKRYPKLNLPEAAINTAMLVPPLPEEEARKVEPMKGPNVSDLPELTPLPDEIAAPVLLKVDDNVSTDEISPAGARALPFARTSRDWRCSASPRLTSPIRSGRRRTRKPATSSSAATTTVRASREHAAIAPRYLGLRIVIAKSFARIHWQNLANYGVLALEFVNAEDYDAIDQRHAPYGTFGRRCRTRRRWKSRIRRRKNPLLCGTAFHPDRSRMCWPAG